MQSNADVLLLAHGIPDRIGEIPTFMRHTTGGRDMADPVLKGRQHRYALIGRSPLTEITLGQAEAAERQLGVCTYVRMRNWRPLISDVIAQMKSDEVEHAVAICLAPHNSRTSVGLYSKALGGAVRR